MTKSELIAELKADIERRGDGPVRLDVRLLSYPEVRPFTCTAFAVKEGGGFDEPEGDGVTVFLLGYADEEDEE